MFFNDDISGKGAFSLVSKEYDLGRPAYPDDIYRDALLSVKVDVDRGEKIQDVLEIGSGSGQATTDLAKLASHLDCIEPGKSFAELLRKKFALLDQVKVFKTDFENFQNVSRYDLVVSACSLHWIPKEYFYSRIHSILKPDGWFLGIWHQPKFSKNVCEIIEKTIKLRFPEFQIPHVGKEENENLEKGFYEFSYQRGFKNCWKKTYSSSRELSPSMNSALIWSYVNISTLSDAERMNLQDNLKTKIHCLPMEDTIVTDQFQVVMGQNDKNCRG